VGQIITGVTSSSIGNYTFVNATVVNDTTQPIWIFHYPALALLTPDGELASPRYLSCNDAIFGFGHGATLNASGAFPNPPAMPAGSYVLFFTHGAGAVARYDFGGTSPGFPDIHVFPSAILNGFTSHAFDPWSGTAVWSIGNVSSVPFTFSAGDTLRVLAATGGAPVAVFPLAGLIIQPGKVMGITLPTLPPAPYLVEVTWTDPSAGSQLRRIGVRDHQQVDLHFPRGRNVPIGGNIEAIVGLQYAFIPGATPAPTYALAIGLSSASTVLPGGVLLPLAIDPLVLASLTDGIGGLLQNNTGVPPSVYVPFCPADRFMSPSILLNHPNIPALSGVVLRVAAAAYDPVSGAWGASQVAEISLQ
jgi:hypothetical protein